MTASASRRRLSGVLTVSALAAGSWAIGLGAAPTANASCVSAFGLGNSASCTSTLTTIAIALGSNAQAHADGQFSTAVAFGDGALAGSYGWFSSATAIGPISGAVASDLGFAFAAGGSSSTHAGTSSGDLGNVAIAFGGSEAQAYGGNLNLAVSLFGNNSHVLSLGTGNAAFNVGNNNTVSAKGTFTSAANIFTDNSQVQTSPASVLSSTVNIIGHSNTVLVGNGPFAIAAALFQNGNLIVKDGPGININ